MSCGSGFCYLWFVNCLFLAGAGVTDNLLPELFSSYGSCLSSSHGSSADRN
jgi:hypothetical protein